MRNVCVYCGSSAGSEPYFIEAARALGRVLAERDLGLVYGGASIGMMGAVADEVLRHGGRVIGVIPESLMQNEVAHSDLTELHVTAGMHERKTLMESHSDAFIALPGGLGTLEELFEILTWAQLGFHNKPCGVLNVAGYFDQLLGFLDQCVATGFIRHGHRNMLQVADSPENLLERFATWQRPELGRWWEEPREKDD